MDLKIAAKRLTKSDLSLFHWHYHEKYEEKSKQKAINLNANILVGELFPDLPDIADEKNNRLLLDMQVLGPDMKPALGFARKIIKGDTYKNWRLDGEIIHNPDDDPNRFNVLDEGDIVLLVFEGEDSPEILRAYFLAQESGADQSIHGLLNGYLGPGPMKQLSVEDLDDLISRGDVPTEHPIRELLLRDAIEDLAMGGYEGAKELRRRRSSRTMTNREIENARLKCAKIGRDGEELFNAYLDAQKRSGGIKNYEWVARINAISPFDFTVEPLNGQPYSVDVKTTEGGFLNRIHVSFSELVEMTDSRDYNIARVYKIDGDRAKLRFSHPMKDIASGIMKEIAGLPEGVSIDSISISPEMINWEGSVDLDESQMGDA